MATRMTPDDLHFERTVGAGAFSKVLAARHTQTDQRFAVKVITKRQILSCTSEEERDRLLEVARREARLLMVCDHPGIVRFHAAMQTNDDLMYVTELCDGGELLEAIRRRGSLPLAAVRHLIAELVDVTVYLHTRPKRSFPVVCNAPLKNSIILHRDIKPENIMMTASRHMKLIDFGSAIQCEPPAAPSIEGEVERHIKLARASTFVGTTHYMSPELLHDNFTCQASDYWAIGCVMYHALTGKRPFEGSTQYLLLKGILEDEVVFPGGLDADAVDLMQRLFVKDPTKRLGAGDPDDLRRHRFFRAINWSSLFATEVRGLWRWDAEWVEDSKAKACLHCQQSFSVIRRRHHCRNCGHVFCDGCSRKTALIPESSYTAPERVCDACFVKLSTP